MSALLVSLLLLSPLACSTLPSRGQLVMRDVNFPLRDLRLPSGMRVIVEEDSRSPVVAVVSLVGVGSANNPSKQEGLAHLVEHLTFRSRPDAKSNVWTLLARAGAGEVNAFTSLDYTLYHAAAPKEALAELLRIEGHRLRAPLAGVDAKVFEVEREVVRNELRERNETGYTGQVFTWLQEASFPAGHPYARSSIGTHQSLSALTLQDARSFVRQHYRPENITLVIVGDVDLATIDKLVAEQLPPALVGEGIPLAPDKRLPEQPPEPPLVPKAPLARYEAAVPTPELYISWVLPRGFDSASAIHDFVRTAMARELWASMREDGDIAGIQTDLVPARTASLLVCRIVLRQGAHPERSAEAVLNQLFRVWNTSGDATEQLVRNARFGEMRLSAISDMALEAEHVVSRAVRRAELTHFNLDARAYSRSLQALAQLSASDITDFAYKYLPRERAHVVYVSPLGTTVSDTSTSPVGISVSSSEDDAEAQVLATLVPRVPAPGVASYRTVRLENGLEVIIGNRPGMPLVTVGLTLRGGSSDTGPLGAAELANRLAYPETNRAGTPRHFGFRMRRLVGRDHVQYVLSGAAGNVGNMLAILSEEMSSIRTEDSLVRYYKEEVLPYIRSVEAWPQMVAERDFRKALYGDHPYGQVATASDVETISTRAIHEWLKQTHHPANGTVAIVGEVDVDQVEQLAREWLGRWHAKGDGLPLAAPPPPEQSIVGKPRFVITERPGATQAQLQVGCLLPTPDEAAATRYSVLAELASERLTQALRHELGASYGFHGSSALFRGGTSQLVLRGTVDNAHLPHALKAFTQHLAELSAGTFRPGELARTQRRLLNDYAVSLGTSGERVTAVLSARNLGWSLGAVDELPAHLSAVTEKAVSQDFTACTQGRFVFSILGDPAVVRAAVQEMPTP
ncbi:insulinase family protein [Archangium violaceum]|uniref:M16 family metallopeptidase n=1 Tax=Archangium violaceum TaxID=83451 RepID=UPI00193BEDB6|nr:M16 family metallopeptidase [Archangium violaceum]QRK06436.1 insulinase family protein [Archangium violaceum]